MYIQVKLLVIAKLLSLVSGVSTRLKQFAFSAASFASAPSSLHVMNRWLTLPEILSAALTAPTDSGLLPERAKDTSSVFRSGETNSSGVATISVVPMA